jgi:Flp pilus assembly pilin Flp
MLRNTVRAARRKGQALVEYALLVAGIALVSVVAVAVLGEKTRDVLGVMAAILPSAHADDNKPIAEGVVIPLDHSGSAIVLDSANLVSSSGIDRYSAILGPGGGELLIVD